MASDWIKVKTDLATDPRLVRLARRLKVIPAFAVGPVVMFWSVCDHHAVPAAAPGGEAGARDGELAGYTAEDVDAIVGVPGFCQAYAEVGWARIEAERIVLINWQDHNGSSAKSRAQDTERKRLAREKMEAPAPRTDATVRTPTRTPAPNAVRHESGQNSDTERTERGQKADQRREEKRREEPKAEAEASGSSGGAGGKPLPQQPPPPPPPVATRQSPIGQSQSPEPWQPPAVPPDPSQQPPVHEPGLSAHPNPQTPTPKPETPNPELGTRNPTVSDFDRWAERPGERAALLSAAVWKTVGTHRELGFVNEACRWVEVSWQRGEIVLLEGETFVGFLVRRARAYGASDQCRVAPTTLKRWLVDKHWLDPDEKWADSKTPPGGRGGSGGGSGGRAEDGGLSPERVEALRAFNLAEQERRRAEDERAAANRPSTMAVSEILGRVRRGKREAVGTGAGS